MSVRIQEKQLRLEASRWKVAFCERMLDPNYERAVRNRLAWICRHFIRRGFMYVQNARKLVTNIDPRTILNDSTTRINHGGVTIQFDLIHQAMGAEYFAACHSRKYLIWLLDAFVWTRVIEDGDHAISSRVVQCLI